MTDTIDRQIDKLLDDHAPEGTAWVVVDMVTEGYGKAHGPFDSFTEGWEWLHMESTGIERGQVLPLFQP